MENEIGPHIQNITKREIDIALEEEIFFQILEDGVKEVDNLIERWKRKEMRLSEEVSYDMGWQKHLSDHRYDSISGHGFMVRKHIKLCIEK